jgi:EAL and modified HD-GYP domain-containing signal transduction protein
MLIVYSSGFENGSTKESPLMTLVKSRTNLMVEVAKLVIKKDTKALLSKAYFVGIISLMDTLFSIPIERIIQELSVDEDIKEALLQRTGILGELYMFAQSVENFNVEEIESFSKKYNLKIEDLEKLTTEVLKNANEFEMQRSSL